MLNSSKFKEMGKYKKILFLLIFSTFFVFVYSSCKDLLTAEQELNITEDKLFDDWYEYRSVIMGLYGLQQNMVEQILVLGELRADLLTTTDNADSDLIEVNNFNISKENKYASPVNFFKLISSCNSFIRILERERPEILDPNSAVTNFDRLYGEVLCMRAWAYFNAVRIYGKVPFVHESLVSIEEVNDYLNSTQTYVDSIDIIYGKDGYNNDTIYNKPVTLEKQYFDQDMIINYFTKELESKVKEVGVNHFIENNDNTWEITIWNTYAMKSLLGIMYLTKGDLAKAAQNFEEIIYNETDNFRYQLDQTFELSNWRNIHSNISPIEHIYTLWFNKGNLQQNQFQSIFEARFPHKYMLKPTKEAILKWETIWDDFALIVYPNNPGRTILDPFKKGISGDFHRGYGVSYVYLRNGMPIPEDEIKEMLYLKSEDDFYNAHLITENADTVVWKYSVNKNIFDQDANFIIYRAADIHLWLAEVYTYWAYNRSGNVSTFITNAINIVNDGSNYSASASRVQLGVRGRVGFGEANEKIRIEDIIFQRDPFTNEVSGYLDYTGNFTAKQIYLEDQIMEEKARELAFEGERFYDLIRVAKRRNDPSLLAKKVSNKFPEGKREKIYNLLLDERNWYINYFE